jgi:adenylate cyclase
MFCDSSFDGFSAPVFKMIGKGPSGVSSKFCNICQIESSKFIGGTEIDLTLLFADVRGSTSLSAGMNPSEFSKIISRFFGVYSKIILKSGVWVDRLVGGQIIGMCIPYYVGGNH